MRHPDQQYRQSTRSSTSMTGLRDLAASCVNRDSQFLMVKAVLPLMGAANWG